jgi:hypothetical protein
MPREALIVPAALRRPVETPLSERAAWSLDDTAKATSLSTRMLEKLVKGGVIPHGRIGSRLIFDPPTIRRWIAARCGAAVSVAGSFSDGATTEGGDTP